MSAERDGGTKLRKLAMLPANLGAFLFAEAGVEPGGMPLTAVSALARLGLDPWDEAGRLAKLRDADAVGQLACSLAALPGALLPDPTGVARRLVGLLPGRGSPPPSSVGQSPGLDLPGAQRDAVRLAAVVGFTILALLLTGYAASVAGKASASQPPAAIAGQP